ncbi:MAG TPA: redox-regulated ATPase YchF [Thermoanaerobaculia bacterium]|nr:redox-regulated ATPase YchF [Thermoanaerobaculia bacterium]
MQLGIVGWPKVGKTLLFNLLTASRQETGKFSASLKVHAGTARVEDPRLDALRDLFSPRKFTPATIDYVDLPGLAKGESGAGPDLAVLKPVDALAHVVRCFEDPEILHAAGSVDPVRDIHELDLELVLADHELVSRRLERLVQAAKRGLNEDEKRERALLGDVVLPALESERPLRELVLDPDGERRLRGFQLLSAKPMLYVLNVAENRVAEPPPAEIAGAVGRDAVVIVVSAPIEEEISRLEGEDQKELLAELGLAEPSTRRLIRSSYALLGLESFFTVGEDEVRAWTVRRGTSARDAAAKIHSDIARGFIRAEVVSWRDLVELRSWAACREHARLHLEGKDYPVADGDVINFRFNV